jgi:hypothetical protein
MKTKLELKQIKSSLIIIMRKETQCAKFTLKLCKAATMEEGRRIWKCEP